MPLVEEPLTSIKTMKSITRAFFLLISFSLIATPALAQDEVLKALDKNISTLNDDYAYVRKYNLNTPIISILKTSKFHEFLAFQGKKGSQNKMPRVLNETQKVDWISFING